NIGGERMHICFSKEQETMRNLIRDFAKEEVAPEVERMENMRRFPRELIEKMGSLGFMGIPKIGRASCRERGWIVVGDVAVSSRRRHTRSKRDWSSDVCSSDLKHRRRAHAHLFFQRTRNNA